MAPLKPVLFAGLVSALASSSFCSGDSCETGDQTALLQSHLSRKSDLSLAQHSAESAAFFPKLSSLNDPSTRKHALLEIEKTAVKLASMDQTEATPVVIQVCTETAELLNTTVLYAIIQEDYDDRQLLVTAYAEFDEPERQRQEAEAAINAAEEVVTQRADALAFCRTVEEQTCINETICTTEENDHCSDRDRVELELQEIDEEIHTSWCLDGNVRTGIEFRRTTVEVFHRYTEKLTELERLQLLCDEVLTHCETTLTTYTEQATQCNTKQSELQMASCEYRHVVAAHLAAYQQGFLAALDFYNNIVAVTMIREADRKVEWDVLTRVICLLLTLTNENNGVVSNSDTEARIQACWDDEVDTSHLDIDYLDPPDMLSLPELPPYPCTADYDDHYNLGPPAACAALVEIHNTHATSECSCSADEVVDAGLILGHYLMVDPALEMTVAGGQWTIQMDGVTYGGQLSSEFTSDFPALSQAMMTDEQLDPAEEDYVGPIGRIAWAYPSEAVALAVDGPMDLGQRFASRGGMVFMSASGEVIDVRELASVSAAAFTSDGALGQPVSATLSFSSAEEITDEQAEAACPSMHAVVDTSRYYALGAREYCWAMGTSVAQCANGCFIYNMVNGKVVFPLIGGMHLTVQAR